MKKISIIFVTFFGVIGIHAQTAGGKDSIAQDLTDLERKIATENIVEDQDTINLGARKQRNFNALPYIMDDRHRYLGDRWEKGGFFRHTFFDFGADIVLYQPTVGYKFTPQTGIAFRLGKEISPMSAFRIGFARELGFVSKENNENWTTRLSADYLFNFSNYLLGYRPERPFSVSGILGIGWQYSNLTRLNGSSVALYMNSKANSFNIHTGLQMKFFAGSHAAISIEPFVMAGADGMNFTSNKSFNRFGYGVNASYIWYFYNTLLQQQNSGEFKRRFLEGERLFYENPYSSGWRRPWFLEYSMGTSFYGRVPLEFQKTVGYGVNAGIGQWLSSAIGVRAGLDITNTAWVRGTSTESMLGKSGIYFDALLNPFGFTRKYNWDSSVGINLFAGYELGKLQLVHANSAGKSIGNYAGYRLGTQLWARLSHDLHLTLSPTYTLLQHHGYEPVRERYDQFDLRMGLTVLFRDYTRREYDQIPTRNDSPERGFILGGGLGWNTTANRWRYSDYKRELLLNGNAFVGYNFNMYHGVKLMGDYVANPIWEDNSGHMEKRVFKNTFLSLDYQFNLLNAMTGYNPHRRWGVNLYLGPSVIFSNTDKSIDFGANFGGMLSYRVLRNLSLYYSHTVYWMRRNHYDSPQVYTTPGAVTNVLNLGLLYNSDGFFRTFVNLPWRDLFYGDPSSENWRRPWFIDYYIGPSFYTNVPLEFGQTRGFSVSAGLGKWLSPALGFRGGVDFSNAPWTKSGIVESMLGKAGVYADMLINPFGFKRNYNWDSTVGLNLLAGYEIGKLQIVHPNATGKTIGGYGGVRLGGQLWTRLSEDFRLTLAPTYTLLTHRTDNPGNKRYNEFDVRMGLTMMFREPSRRDYDQIPNKNDQPEKGFFLGGGLGWNSAITRWRYSGYNRGLVLNLNGFAGYNFNMYHGIKLMAEHLSNPIWENKGSNIVKNTFNNTFLSLDYQLNILNVMTGFNPHRRWGANIYLGPSLVFSDTDKSVDFGANFGGMLSYRIMRNLSLFYSHTVYWMRDKHYDSPLIYTTPGALTNALNIGVLYNSDGFFHAVAGLPWKSYLLGDPSSSNFRRPWFIDYSVGTSFFTKVPLSFGKTNGFGVSAGLGQWISPVIGARAGVTFANSPWVEGTKTESMLGKAGVYFDAMINPFGFVNTNYNWDSKAGLNLIAGYEMGKLQLVNAAATGKVIGGYGGVRLGGQLWTRLSEDFRLTLSPIYTLINHRSGNSSNDKYNELDVRLGLTMLFREPSRRNYDSIPAKGDMPYSGFFIGGGLGWNSAITRWRYSDYNRGLVLNAHGFAGYNFNMYHGAKLMIEHLSNPVWEDNGGTMVKNTFKNTFLSVDYQLNILNAMTGFNPHRRWGANIFLGPSLVFSNTDKSVDFGANFGGMLSYRVLPNLSLFYSHTVYWMRDKHYNSPLVYTTPGAITNALNVGLLYNSDGFFRNQAWKGFVFGDPTSPNFRRPWFVDYSIGTSFYGKVPLDFGNTAGFGVSAGLGQWISPVLGVRAGAEFSNSPWTKGTDTESMLGKAGVYLDALVNPFGFTLNYNWDSAVGFNFLAGYEMGKLQLVNSTATSKAIGGYGGVRLGGQLWTRLSNDLRLTLSPVYTLLNHRSGQPSDDRYNEFDLRMGITMLFREPSRRLYDETPSNNDLPERGFFVGGGLGWNSAITRWRYSGHNRGLILNFNGFAGYDLNMYHGVKLMAEYVSNPVWEKNGGNMVKNNFKNTFLSLDYQFNILNAMTGYNPHRRWGANIYLGPSMVFSDVDKKVDFGANFGGMLSYRVLPNLSLFYSHTIYWMRDKHYNSPLLYTTPGAISNALNVGVVYNITGLINSLNNRRASAGERGNGNGNKDGDRDAAIASLQRPAFFDYGYGYGYFPMLPIKSNLSWGSAMHFMGGVWATPFFGVRAGFNFAKGAGLSTPSIDGISGHEKLHSVGLGTVAIDALVNPIGFSRNYNWNTPAGVNLILGYQTGAMLMSDAQHLDKSLSIYVDGFRTGAQIWVRLNRDLRLNIEPVYSTLNAHGRLFLDPNTTTVYRRTETGTSTPLRAGNNFSIKMGLTVMLNRLTDANWNDSISNQPTKFFTGVGGGWNILLSRHRLVESGAKLNGLFFLGYRFNQSSAIRAGFEFISDRMKTRLDIGGVEQYSDKRYNLGFVSLAYQMDVLSAFRGYDPNRKIDFNFFAGPALAMRLNDNKKMDAALNLGFLTNYKLSRNVSLFYNHNIYMFGVGNEDVLPTAGILSKVTALNTINLGLMLHF